MDHKVPRKGIFPGNDMFFLACNCFKCLENVDLFMLLPYTEPPEKCS